MDELRSELARKAVHVGMGFVALSLAYLTPLQAMVLAATALAFNLFLLHRLTGRKLLRPGEKARGFSLGIALYPAAVLALLVVFRNNLELAAAGWGLIAFGDGMAAVVGVLVGGPRLPWNRRKSWSGLAAFVLWGAASAAFLIHWTQSRVATGAVGETVAWVGTSFRDDAVLAGATLLLIACGFAALAAGLAESLDSGIDDNIVVPLIGGAVLWLATLVDPALLSVNASRLETQLLYGAAINLALAIAAYGVGGVGLSGGIVGWLLGTSLYTFAGWPGFLMLLVFFLLGTACTKIGYRKKAALGIAQEKGGRRGAGNAIANTTVGVACAFLAVATPYREPFLWGLVAAFGTAACDTVSSEVGQAFGRRHVLITTFRRVPPGTDGAISIEGTVAGFLGGALVAAVGWAAGLIGPEGALVATLAAFFGATVESYIGATLEAVHVIDNEVVNFTNTAIGAIAAALVAVWWM